MNTIWLMGGLGNQLFQINYGSYLESLGDKVIYNFCLTQDNIFSRILGWKTHEFVAADHVCNSSFYSELNFLPILASKLPFLNHYSNFDHYSVPSKNHFGYRQTKELNKFVHFQHSFPEVSSNEDYVMHFRAGDMNGKQVAFDYYNNVLEKLPPGSVRVITSAQDEFRFFRSRFPQFDFHIQSGSLIEDFSYMLGSTKFIGAPSTLSWWASKLSKKSELFLPRLLVDELGEVGCDHANFY